MSSIYGGPQRDRFFVCLTFDNCVKVFDYYEFKFDISYENVKLNRILKLKTKKL